jgi:hypothetical protein
MDEKKDFNNRQNRWERGENDMKHWNTEKTNNSFDKSVSSILVLRDDNPQKTQSSGSL